MTRAAIEQLLYMMNEAFQGNGEHSLLANTKSLKPDDWHWRPEHGERSAFDIVQHVVRLTAGQVPDLHITVLAGRPDRVRVHESKPMDAAGVCVDREDRMTIRRTEVPGDDGIALACARDQTLSIWRERQAHDTGGRRDRFHGIGLGIGLKQVG